MSAPEAQSSNPFEQVIDRFLPAAIEGREELYRSQLYLGSILATIFSCVLQLPLLFIVVGVGYQFFVVVFTLVSLGLQLFWFTRHASPKRAGILLVFQLLISITLMCADSGGNLSPVVVWYGVVAILGSLLIDGRWGLISAFSAVVLFTSFPLLASFGFTFDPRTPHTLTTPTVFVSGISSMLVIGFLGWLYERSRHRAEQALEHSIMSMKELEVAKDAALLANQSKSEFLATMSHELRTPLNAIIGYAELLQDDAADLNCSEIIPDLDKIRGSGEHLLTLINDVLDLSKIEAGKMELHVESFSLPALVTEVEQTIKPLITKNHNVLRVVFLDPIEQITLDRVKLRQSLFNLLGNASKFTEGGEIIWQISLEEGPGGRLMIHEITDTGIGMSQEQAESLFHMFQQGDSSRTRRYGGTGLGLAITKRLCQLMGGDISVESVEGRGSTFRFWLPTKPHTQASNPKAPLAPLGPTKEHPGKEKLVLAIDDDPQVLDLLSRMLSKEGYRVELATNGQEGLAMAERLHPQAITLDVMMPEMDGWSVLEELKRSDSLAQIPVIMLTIVDERRKGLSMGAVEVLSKPFERERLLTTLEHITSG